MRYYGLQATCKLKKVRAVLASALQRVLQSTFEWLDQVRVKLSYQERMKRAYGLDPLVCEQWGAELWLWYIWHPDYGLIYDELDQLKAGQYEPLPEFVSQIKSCKLLVFWAILTHRLVALTFLVI